LLLEYDNPAMYRALQLALRGGAFGVESVAHPLRHIGRPADTVIDLASRMNGAEPPSRGEARCTRGKRWRSHACTRPRPSAPGASRGCSGREDRGRGRKLHRGVNVGWGSSPQREGSVPARGSWLVHRAPGAAGPRVAGAITSVATSAAPTPAAQPGAAHLGNSRRAARCAGRLIPRR
jgi:hypothetical protein